MIYMFILYMYYYGFWGEQGEQVSKYHILLLLRCSPIKKAWGNSKNAKTLHTISGIPSGVFPPIFTYGGTDQLYDDIPNFHFRF